jgi:signal transduction histidine kinase
MGSSNNDIYVMIISVTLVLLIILVFIVSFLFIYKSRQVKHQAEMESVKEKFNQEILKTQLEIKEQTLKNIAEEIHDNVGQVLSLVVLNLSAVELDDVSKAAAKIESTTKLVEKAVADLRNLSKTMDADNIANVGLVAITKFELDMLERTGVYKVACIVLGEEKRLDIQRELVLYRIIQESLNNIIKHAKAGFINIILKFSPTQLDIEIKDDGIGFNITENKRNNIYTTGAGIKNMEKRVNLIGGSFDIKSMPLAGTTILITIPLAS